MNSKHKDEPIVKQIRKEAVKYFEHDPDNVSPIRSFIAGAEWMLELWKKSGFEK